MVNFGLNSASILGLFLAVAGAGLYFMRSIRPELSRDHDIFFAAVGLLCGFILIFQGWRLDPILQFGQFLLTGTTIFFAVETLRLRQSTTEQAKRNTPFVDEERRVSRNRVYTTQAELDDEDEDDSYPNKRRLRGVNYDTEEPKSTRTRRVSRPNPNEGYNYSPEDERPPSSRKRSSEPPRADVWQEEEQEWSEEPTTRKSRRPKGNSRDEVTPPPPQQRNNNSRRPNSTGPTRGYSTNEYGDDPPAAYVDYQPIDEEETNESNLTRTDKKPRRDTPDDDSEY